VLNCTLEVVGGTGWIRDGGQYGGDTDESANANLYRDGSGLRWRQAV
jgi:hypothetical protein